MKLLAWKQYHLVLEQTPSYTVSKVGVNQTDNSWDTAIFVSHPPVAVAVQTHCHDVNLLICFIRYATHGLPGTSSCTTPYVQLGCQHPDVWVLSIQVPAWDLDLDLQDQGWGKTWLSALHPGQKGLCHHGQMGTSRWSTREWPSKVLRLHRQHTRQQNLTMSLCLGAGRHNKEVWRIHRWASRLDVLTGL